MAAPLVAGTAALVLAIDPGLTPDRVARRLVRSGAALCDTALRQIDAASALLGGAPATVSCR